MTACATPLPFETLVAWLAGDLDPARAEALEEHLFSCAPCTAEAARVAAVTESFRAMVPPIVTREMISELRTRGLRVEDNDVRADVPNHVVFAGQDIIVHHLRGLPLADAERVAVSIRVEQTDEVLYEQPSAPFERAAGEVLIACQRHFASLPPDVVFVVTTTDRDGARRTDRFFVSHDFRTAV
jgi:hypothetical protein